VMVTKPAIERLEQHKEILQRQQKPRKECPRVVIGGVHLKNSGPYSGCVMGSRDMGPFSYTRTCPSPKRQLPRPSRPGQTGRQGGPATYHPELPPSASQMGDVETSRPKIRHQQWPPRSVCTDRLTWTVRTLSPSQFFSGLPDEAAALVLWDWALQSTRVFVGGMQSDVHSGSEILLHGPGVQFQPLLLPLASRP
jgi:hypothetical protein